MPRFSTIDDIAAYLRNVDPGFAGELTNDVLHEIIRQYRTSPYERITDAELSAMIHAAYAVVMDDDRTF